MTNRSTWMTRIALAVCLTVASVTAWAAEPYPSQTVRIVVPYAPGGPLDLSARTIAAKLTDSLGKPVVVENRPGNAALIGVQGVIRGPADGHTLVLVTNSTIVISPHLNPLPYDTVADVAPVAIVAVATSGIAVGPNSPIRSLADLIRMSKERPDGISYAHTGVGGQQHLAGELLKNLSGANLVGISYKGAGPAASAMLNDEVPVTITDVGLLAQHARAGRARILAVISSSRMSVVPDVPTVAELGFPSYGADTLIGIFAPRNTPPEIIERLNTEIMKVVTLPEVRTTFGTAGMEIAKPMKPDEIRAKMAADRDLWGELIRKADIKGE